MPALIHRADNTRRATEDSPARIVIAFDGDRSKLPLDERLFADQFRMFTKQEFPYAILMYIWENRAPVGSVIENLHTSRIRMVVADSGETNLGTWRDQTRNLYEDYRRAFGEEPGRIKSVAIMTDTDNTGEEAEAFYGDITFLRSIPARSGASPERREERRRPEAASDPAAISAPRQARSRARSMIVAHSTLPGSVPNALPPSRPSRPVQNASTTSFGACCASSDADRICASISVMRRARPSSPCELPSSVPITSR